MKKEKRKKKCFPFRRFDPVTLGTRNRTATHYDTERKEISEHRNFCEISIPIFSQTVRDLVFFLKNTIMLTRNVRFEKNLTMRLTTPRRLLLAEVFYFSEGIYFTVFCRVYITSLIVLSIDFINHI